MESEGQVGACKTASSASSRHKNEGRCQWPVLHIDWPRMQPPSRTAAESAARCLVGSGCWCNPQYPKGCWAFEPLRGVGWTFGTNAEDLSRAMGMSMHTFQTEALS